MEMGNKLITATNV